jgi:hypothetical protein
MIIPYKPKIILALLFAVLVMTAFSSFFFRQIDNIVNADLYNYGLIFDYGWADEYSANSNLYLYSQTLSLILFGNSIAFFFSHIRNRNAFSSVASSFLLFAGAGLSILSVYFSFRLDSIINHDLYSYGLIFNDQWYAAYLFNNRLMLFLSIFGLSLAITSAIAVYSSTRRVIILPTKLLSLTLVANGILALALSLVYSSSILTLVGLGLLFWGITFTYVSTSEHVKKVILETTVSSQMAALNFMLKKQGFESNPVYLPPGYFRNSTTYAVYLQKSGDIQLPSPEIMFEDEFGFRFEMFENSAAVLMTPPGAELAGLFEKTLETSFDKVDLKYLQQNLPELIVEDLEIAQIFEMEIESNTVRVRAVGSIYSGPNSQTEQPTTWSFLGSPLSSAIACSLAKVTGKPVMRTGSKIDSKGKSVAEEYAILQN